MIQQTRGKWSFLEDIGNAVGQYATLRDQKKDKERKLQTNQADVLFKLAQAGALPDGLDGQAVSALQTAGVTPDALFNINKRTKKNNAVADQNAVLDNERITQQIDQGRASAAYFDARANSLETPKPPVVNIKSITDAVAPFARLPNLSWEESYAQLRTLPQFQGVEPDYVKSLYESAKQKYKEERDKEARIGRGRGTGSPAPKPPALSTQLNYWQDLTKTAVDAAIQQAGLMQQPGELTPQQRSAVLSAAIDIVNKSQNPRIPEQFAQGLNLSHFQAALAAKEKANRPRANAGGGGALAAVDALLGGSSTAPAGTSGTPKTPTPADWDAAVQATGGANSTREKAIAWLKANGFTP